MSRRKPQVRRYMMRKSDGYIYPYNPNALKADLSGNLQEVVLTEEQFKAWRNGKSIFEFMKNEVSKPETLEEPETSKEPETLEEKEE